MNDKENITDNSKKMTVYYDHTLSFDNVDDILRNDSLFQTSSFYNLLKDSATMECDLNRDTAFEMATSNAKSSEMPAYLYTLTIKDSSKLFDANKQIPDNKKEALKKILHSEFKHASKYLNAQASLLVDDKTHSIAKIIQILNHSFAPEHTIRIMKTIGIDGTYTNDSNGNKTNLSLFNRDLITNMEREQVMSPIHDEKFNIAPHAKPEERIKELLERKHQYTLKKVGEFDPETRPKMHNEDPKLLFSTPDKHFPLYRAEHVHALNNDRNYKKFLFRTIKKEFNSYSYKQFSQDIKIAQEKNLAPMSAASGAIDPTKIKAKLPQNLTELNATIHATIDHVSQRNLEKMDTGVTNATHLRIRPSDQKIFVAKDLPKDLNVGLLTGLKSLITGRNGADDKSDACRSEYEAYKIYEAFEVNVPKTHLIDQGSCTILLMDYIEGKTLDGYIKSSENIADIDHLKELRDTIAYDFPIDALLCNPDTGSYHNQNIIIDDLTQKPQRIDMGFALAYHAKGHKKDKKEWNVPHLHDFYNFRNTEKSSAHYGGLTNEVILERLTKAEKCMPKVKEVASKENYKIIEKRLNKSLSHFKQLCKIEAEFKNNKDSIGVTQKTQEQKSTAKIDLIAGAKALALDNLRSYKTLFRL